MKIILGSQSPRRKQLLSAAAYSFEVRVLPTDESYPSTMDSDLVAPFIARKKADAFDGILEENELVITADTVVVLEGAIYGKPRDAEHAMSILSALNGKMHEVITAVVIKTTKEVIALSATTKVFFYKLKEEDLRYYVDNFKPFDKAGAYAIQEWIGHVGIERIEGCFYNVMGLPIGLVHQQLQQLLHRNAKLH